MKKALHLFALLFIGFISCNDDDRNLFDKSADERAAEAKAALKQDLIANPWKLKYQPESTSGSYWVLLDFNDHDEVTIKTDLDAEDGRYYEETITYRIDSSLGLELIFESYSFFSFLFEQDQATFGAEYEFNYINKTPDGELVFTSKTDVGSSPVILFQKGTENDEPLLAPNVSTNLNKFSSSVKISYDAKNIDVFLSIDAFRRTANFNFISPKDNTAQGQALSLPTGYILQGDSIVFDTPLTTTFQGNTISIKSILLTELTGTTLNACLEPLPSPLYKGVTSGNDAVSIENSLINNEGTSFWSRSDIYYGHLLNIRNENGERVNEQITTDIKYAAAMLFYTDSKAVGFLLENPDGSTAIVVREFTEVRSGNVVELQFAPEFTIIRTPSPETNLDNIDIYLDLMTAEGKTYLYKLNDTFYEVNNPCSGWSFVFEAL